MAGLRFTLDLYIEEDLKGTLVAGVKVPNALAAKIPAIRQTIRELKAFATKVNEGKENQETTVKATYHVCHNNENPTRPCEPEQEI